MDKQDSFATQEKTNQTARAYLAQTDWYAIRAAEGGTAMPSNEPRSSTLTILAVRSKQWHHYQPR
jgi:hypothetical protein